MLLVVVVVYWCGCWLCVIFVVVWVDGWGGVV